MKPTDRRVYFLYLPPPLLLKKNGFVNVVLLVDLSDAAGHAHRCMCTIVCQMKTLNIHRLCLSTSLIPTHYQHAS